MIRLVRETADGLGHLVGQHFRLARLELMVDLRKVARRAGLMAGLAPLLLVGYALTMAGIGVVIGGVTRVGVALLVIGLVHVVGCGAGMLYEAARLRGTRVMDNTSDEVSRSVTTIGMAAARPRPIPGHMEKASAV